MSFLEKLRVVLSRNENSWRALRVYFIFVALALGCVVVLAQFEIAYPLRGQREMLRVSALLPVFAFGLIGAWLSDRVGPTPPPRGWGAWWRLSWLSIGAGVMLGLLMVFLDAGLGFSSIVADSIGIQSIHVAFPYSAMTYAVGAVIVESMYRIIPIPILLLVVSKFRVSDRTMTQAFWVLALLTSLIEPFGLSQFLVDHSLLLSVIGVFSLATNLFEAWLFRTYGLAAPLLCRLALYSIWHVTVGPMLV